MEEKSIEKLVKEIEINGKKFYAPYMKLDGQDVLVTWRGELVYYHTLEEAKMYWED